MSQKQMDAILNKVALDDEVTKEQFAAAVKGAIQARSKLTYFLWKELEERFDSGTATEILGSAYRRFGCQAGESWKDVTDAASALRAQSSKAGFLVFDQTLISASSDYAQKNFGSCPHVEAFRELGATDQEIRVLCQDVLSEGDYGNLDTYQGLSLTFKKQIGCGDDHCEYCVSYKPSVRDKA